MGTKSFLSRDLVPGSTDQQALGQAIAHLLKCQLMSVRSVSNFRSLISILLANSHEYKPENIKQLRAVAEEVAQDSTNYFQYAIKVAGNLLNQPTLNHLGSQVQSFRAEIDALIQDSQNMFYLYSPLIYEYCTGVKQFPTDPISVLSSAPTFQKLQDQMSQLDSQQEEIAALQQHVQLLQEQNKQLQKNLDETRLQHSRLAPSTTNITTGMLGQTQANVASEERLQKLETENQLLRQNVVDLRNTLQTSHTAEKSAQNVLEVLKDSMGRDKATIAELQTKIKQQQEKLSQYEVRGVDIPQIEQIQLGLKQLLGMVRNSPQFTEGNDSRSLAKNVGQVALVIAELQKNFLEAANEAKQLRDLQEAQKLEIEKQNTVVSQTQADCKNQIREMEMTQQELIEKARQETQQQSAKALRELGEKMAKVVEENRQLKETAEILQLQLQTLNINQSDTQLRASIKKMVKQFKQELRDLETDLGIPQGQDLDFSQVKRRIQKVRANEAELDRLKLQLDQIYENQKQIETYIGVMNNRQ